MKHFLIMHESYIWLHLYDMYMIYERPLNCRLFAVPLIFFIFTIQYIIRDVLRVTFAGSHHGFVWYVLNHKMVINHHFHIYIYTPYFDIGFGLYSLIPKFSSYWHWLATQLWWFHDHARFYIQPGWLPAKVTPRFSRIILYISSIFFI